MRIGCVDDLHSQSIKEPSREKGRKRLRRRVGGKAKLPRTCPKGKKIVTTNANKSVFLGNDRSVDVCDHEEADSRLLVHLKNALENGSTKCVEHSVDFHVEVILLAKSHYLVSVCHV